MKQCDHKAERGCVKTCPHYGPHVEMRECNYPFCLGGTRVKCVPVSAPILLNGPDPKAEALLP